MGNNSTPEPKKEGGISTGVIFLIIGLFSAILTVGLIYFKAQDEDFYSVTSTVNGIQTTEHSPGFVIGMLVFCALFSVAFIVVGIIMIKKRFLGGVFTLEDVVEFNKKNGRVAHPVSTFTSFASNGIHVERRPGISFLPKLFIALGALLITIGVALFVWDRSSLASLIPTEATVTRTYSVSRSSMRHGLGRSYFATIEYMIDGQRYESRISVSFFFHATELTVYCDPKNPLICRPADEYLAWYLALFGCGIGFTVISSVFLTVMKRREEETRGR